MDLVLFILDQFNPYDNFGKFTKPAPQFSECYKFGPCDIYKTKWTLFISIIHSKSNPLTQPFPAHKYPWPNSIISPPNPTFNITRGLTPFDHSTSSPTLFPPQPCNTNTIITNPPLPLQHSISSPLHPIPNTNFQSLPSGLNNRRKTPKHFGAKIKHMAKIKSV